MIGEYEVGSLSNIISGVPATASESVSPKKFKIKFQEVKQKKKPKYGVHKKNASFQEMVPTFKQDSSKKKIKTNTAFSHQMAFEKIEEPSNYDSNILKKKRKNKFISEENEDSSDYDSYALKKKRKREHISSENDMYKNKNIKDEEESSEKQAKFDELSKERSEREIFVGNVPVDTTKKMLKALFREFGKIEAVRFRGIASSDPKIPKKVAAIKKNFHPDRKSIIAYVRFQNSSSLKKALALNGSVYKDHHLRVDLVSNKKLEHNMKNSVFVGNLPFRAEEDELWNMFESCGKISNIRIIRDNFTRIGKGFGYINFENADAVELALKLDGEEFSNRKLRVSRCSKKKSKSPWKAEQGNKKSNKKSMKNSSLGSFQGQNIDENRKSMKKKKKINKGDRKKMILIKKISPFPNSSLKKGK